VLSVPVTFASLHNNDIDVFLGNWMPAQEADRSRYVNDGSAEVIGANLTGAKYTLAVPDYTYAAGLKDFKDIQRFAPVLNNSIYGIEPGNDGNRHVLEMLKQNQFGLGEFKLIESSEQGMLAQVERAYREKNPVVFLAWEPHPMNMRFALKYLSGAMKSSAPISAAQPFTPHRDPQGLQRRVPQHRQIAQESQVFVARRERNDGGHIGPARGTRDRGNGVAESQPDRRQAWLEGVLTFDGGPAGGAVTQATRTPRPGGFEQWIVAHKIRWAMRWRWRSTTSRCMALFYSMESPL